MKPFIIWTLRRTGGTTLASILEEHSGLPTIEHEPFLPGRVLAGVAEAHRDGDRAGFDEGVSQLLRNAYPIKHCIEVHTKSFSIDLADRLGDEYHHVVLTRRDEAMRLFSLAMAEVTGAWRFDADPKLQRPIRLPVRKFRREYRRCRPYVESVTRSLGDRLMHVYFEDLYEGDRSARLDEVNRVARFVGLDPIPEDSELAARVVEREQSKEARAYLTNEEEFLAKVTRPGLADRVLEAVGMRSAGRRA